MLPALPTPTDGDRLAAAAQAGPGRWTRGLRWTGRLASLLQGLAARAGLPNAITCASPARSLLAPLLLVLLLAGCGASLQPPHRVVLDALALQIRLTQDQVAQALGLEPAGLPEVSRVRVEEQEAVPIGEARGLRLTGRFDWRLADDPIRVDSPFQLFLQRGERGQSWRLARPLAVAQDGPQEWITEPLPLPGDRPTRRAAASASGSDAAR